MTIKFIKSNQSKKHYDSSFKMNFKGMFLNYFQKKIG